MKPAVQSRLAPKNHPAYHYPFWDPETTEAFAMQLAQKGHQSNPCNRNLIPLRESLFEDRSLRLWIPNTYP